MQTSHYSSARKGRFHVGFITLAVAGMLGLTSCQPVTPQAPQQEVEIAPTQAAAPLPTEEDPSISAGATHGPLQVSSENPRYFMDQSGKEILLTGSHTWSVLADNGGSNPPPIFDYEAWLDFMEANGHNFFRLWAWEQSRWTLETADENYWFFPLPYLRTGPGNALDGQPRFDLDQFNPSYFERIRERVLQARARGIYVAVVLFNGWSNVSQKPFFAENNAWQGHPFNPSNNINGIDGDTNNDNSGEEVHELGIPAVTAFQEAYVRQVIDTVNDLDNVLYEISNESHAGSVDWQYHMIDYIHTYEAGKPFQHPVGMTAPWPDALNAPLFASEAEWISVNDTDQDYWTPQAADGSKVLITDTDHLCGICGDRAWAWRSFTRGHNPIFMDGYDGTGYGVGGDGFDFNDPTWVNLRTNLGYILSYANRMNLGKTTPQSDLCSSEYCLANLTLNQAEIIVFAPQDDFTQVDLTGVTGSIEVEWLNLETGTITLGDTITGGSAMRLDAPAYGDWVIFLYQTANPISLTPTFFMPLVLDETK